MIDYAGIFPPAKLDMTRALDEYLHIIGGPDAWIVSRFVCSTSRLNELADAISANGNTPYIPVAAVGRPSKDRASWEDALSQDAADMNAFQNRMGDRADVEGKFSIPAYHVPAYHAAKIVQRV